MRKVLRAGFVMLCLVLVVCQGAGAFHLSTIAVDPSGSLLPCDPVNISFSISFPVTSGETFPADNELIMETDLEEQQWSWSINLDGLEKTGDIRVGRGFSLNGSELSYPSYVIESVKFTLIGEAPAVERTQNKTLIKIYQADAAGNVIEGSVTSLQTMVINSPCINLRCGSSSILNAAKMDLQTFRVHIDEKAALAVDTSSAEIKYNDASLKITNVTFLPVTRLTEALSTLNAAKADITEGERLLDKAWAEKEIAEAQVPIKNADNIIGGIRVNRIDPPQQVKEMIRKREEAVRYICIATDQVAAGSYSAARENAGIAFARGNESYTIALDYIQQESRPAGTPLSPGCCIAAVGSAGIVIFRKRRRG